MTDRTFTFSVLARKMFGDSIWIVDRLAWPW